MPNDLEKPISDLTAGEAYLRFMACKSSDIREFELLSNRLWTLLYGPATGYAWKVVGGRKGNERQEHLIEDAVQTAFLKIVRQQRTDRNQRTGEEIGGKWTPKVNGARFETWFNGIVGNQVRDLRRKEKGPIGPGLRKEKGDIPTNAVTPKIDESVYTPIEVVADSRSKTAIQNAMDAENEARLNLCLDKLEVRYRDVLMMNYYESKSQTEIAKELDTNSTAVCRWMDFARKSMEKCLGSF